MSILLLYTALATAALLLIGVMLAAGDIRRNRRVATQLPARVYKAFREDTVRRTPKPPADWWNADFHWIEP